VYTVAFLGNGQSYTLQKENGSYLTVDVNGNLVISSTPQGSQFIVLHIVREDGERSGCGEKFLFGEYLHVRFASLNVFNASVNFRRLYLSKWS
jgi:hypothetical protein